MASQTTPPSPESPQHHSEQKEATFNSPGRWQAFLSHTQRNKIATTYVHRLAPSLKQRGFPNIWHDVQMEEQKVLAMKEGVRNSECVIAVITGDVIDPSNPTNSPEGNAYFRRKYCLLELRWAVESRVPIILAMDQKDMANDKIGEMYAQAPDDLKFLFNEQVCKLDGSNPSFWEASVDVIENKMKTFVNGLPEDLLEEYEKSNAMRLAVVAAEERQGETKSQTQAKPLEAKPLGKVPKLPKLLSADVHSEKLEQVVKMLV